MTKLTPREILLIRVGNNTSFNSFPTMKYYITRDMMEQNKQQSLLSFISMKNNKKTEEGIIL